MCRECSKGVLGIEGRSLETAKVFAYWASNGREDRGHVVQIVAWGEERCPSVVECSEDFTGGHHWSWDIVASKIWVKWEKGTMALESSLSLSVLLSLWNDLPCWLGGFKRMVSTRELAVGDETVSMISSQIRNSDFDTAVQDHHLTWHNAVDTLLYFSISLQQSPTNLHFPAI